MCCFPVSCWGSWVLKLPFASACCWLINSTTNLTKMFTLLKTRGSLLSGKGVCRFIERWWSCWKQRTGKNTGEKQLGDREAKEKIYFGRFQISLSQQCQGSWAVCLHTLIRVSTHKTLTHTHTRARAHTSVCVSLCDRGISLHPTGCNPLKTFSKHFN